MKRTWKKALAMLMALAMVLSLCVIPVSAEEVTDVVTEPVATNNEPVGSEGEQTQESNAAEVAQIAEQKYATIAEAIKALPEDTDTATTITLLQDAVGGVKVGEKAVNLVLDLGGYALSIEKGVGSTGTETNGLQLLRGSKVNIQNGTLKVGQASTIDFIIKNYCDLTLENVTIDGAGLVVDQNAAINNCGQLTLKGSGNEIKNIALGNYGVTTGNYHYKEAIHTVIEGGKIDSVYTEGNAWVSSPHAYNNELVKTEIKGGEIGAVGAYIWDANKPALNWQFVISDSTKIKQYNFAAKIGTSYYAALAEAIKAAKAGDSITLLDDVTERVSIDKAVTLDGQGKVLNGTVSVTASGVTIQNVVFSGATAKTADEPLVGVSTDGPFTFTGNTVKGLTGFRTLLSLNVGGVATITGNKFENGVKDVDDQSETGYNGYNAIEFGISAGRDAASGTVISGNTFTDKAFSNNGISFYNLTEGATYAIQGNTFDFAGNGLRISNSKNVSATFEVRENTYKDTIAGEYAGFIIFQDYSKGQALQDFTKLTVNIRKLIGPSGDYLTSNGMGKAQVYYVYDDQGKILTETNQPKVDFLSNSDGGSSSSSGGTTTTPPKTETETKTEGDVKTESSTTTTTNKDGSTTTEKKETATNTATGEKTEVKATETVAKDGSVTKEEVKTTTAADGAKTEEKTTATVDAKTGTAATTTVKTDEAGKSTAQVVVENSKNAKEVTVSADAVKAAAKADEATMTIKTAGAAITLDAGAVAAVAKAEGATVSIAVETVKQEALPEAARDALEEAIVVDLAISVGGTKVSDFSGGTATVSVPYTRTDSAKAVAVFYVDESGKLIRVPGASYDEKTKSVVFTTGHFSYYAVKEEMPLAFTDIKDGDWYYDAVRYVTEAKLFNGTSDATFGPGGTMTREMLAAVLYRKAGSPASEGMVLAEFADGDQISDWAQSAMRWRSTKAS